MLKGKWLLLYVILFCCLAIPGEIMTAVKAEHVPANWEDMELCKWYDLIQGGPDICNFQCDPDVPGKMYGLAETDQKLARYPTVSYDYGRTWSKTPGEIDTSLGYIEELENYFVWFGSGGERTFWMTGSIDFDASESKQLKKFLFTRNSLDEQWRIVTNLTDQFNLDIYDCVRNIIVDYAGKIIIQIRGNILVSSDSGSTWRNTFQGKDSNSDCLAFSPHNRDTAFISCNYNNESLLWKSTDRCETWEPLNLTYSVPGIGREGLVGISCHPVDPGTLFVFIEANRNGLYRYGVKKSVDAGETWTDFGPESGEKDVLSSAIYIDPDNPMHIILATSGDIRIYVSDDAGMTWKGSVTIWIKAYYKEILTASPWDKGTVYLSTAGIFESTDEGENWNRTCPRLNFGYNKHIGHIDRLNPEKMVFLESNSGVFWSEDGGTTWHPGKRFLCCIHDLAIANDSFNSDLLFAVVYDDILYSSDLGKTWAPLDFPEAYIPSYVTCSPTIYRKVYAIAANRDNYYVNAVFVSLDAGDSWQKMNLPDNHYFSDIKDSPHDSSLVLAVGTDTETLREHVFRSTDSGETFERLEATTGYDSVVSGYEHNLYCGFIYYHPTDENVIYASIQVEHISKDKGKTWSKSEILVRLKGSLIILPSNPDVMISTNDITRNAGITWSDMLGCTTYIKFLGNDLIAGQLCLQIARMDNRGPSIQLAGFGQSILKTGQASELQFKAYVVDPSENDVIDHLEICINGDPVGVQIDADTSRESPNWSFIEYYLSWTPLEPIVGLIQFSAMDSFGNMGPLWPNLPR